ncbi:MAG: tetratricopeptide repeat protein, partial [Chitinispirillaceae bacterium]|nr:tetratricopeptide repeat protein [Chitinispirillaceae bacterium]
MLKISLLIKLIDRIKVISLERIKKVFILVSFFIVMTSYGEEKPLEEVFGIDLIGTEAIKRADYSKALQEVLINPCGKDTLFRDFKLGIIYKEFKNYSMSLSLFRSIVERNKAFLPLAYLYIAEIENELGRRNNALATYRTVLSYSPNQKYKEYVFTKLKEMIEMDSSINLTNEPWLEEYYLWLESQKKEQIVDSIKLFIREERWLYLDSLLTTKYQSSLTKKDCMAIDSFLDSVNTDKLSNMALFICAKLSKSCGNLVKAKNYVNILKDKKKKGDTVPEVKFDYFVAQLYYDLKEWKEALERFENYIKKYGKNPEVVLTIARAYRNLNNTSKADEWYNIFLANYPQHNKCVEILWLRAWDYEKKERFDLAGNVYYQIYSKYRKSNRGDESAIRLALCYYKRKKFDSAAVVLKNFCEKNPLSSFIYSAYFWLAKSYIAKGEKGEALTFLRLISRKDPFNYYSYRARMVMAELGDTIELSVDTLCGNQCTILWLDSISSSFFLQNKDLKRELTPLDSSALLCGLYFSAVGNREKADLFLENLYNTFSGNLNLQYKMALFYIYLNEPAIAFKIARRMSWMIPQELKCEMPMGINKLFYPIFYFNIIKQVSLQNDIDPFFVYGVLRQESVFNHKIVSPAGAIGLMQVMPYT